jgi:hypothetical protein
MPKRSAQPPTRNPLAQAFKEDGREFVRRSRRLQIDALVILAVFLMVALYVTNATGLSKSAGFSMAAFVAIVAALVTIAVTLPVAMYFVHVLRVYRPVFELLEWLAEDERLSWLAFDGSGQIPDDPAAALGRIGDRTGDMADYLRVRALQEQGKFDEAKTALRKWTPADPVELVRHARVAELVAFDTTGVDGLASVRAMAEALSDEGARQRVLVRVAVVDARRAGEDGCYSLDGLLAARQMLAREELPELDMRTRLRRPEFRSGILLLVACLPTVALVVLALRGL